MASPPPLIRALLVCGPHMCGPYDASPSVLTRHHANTERLRLISYNRLLAASALVPGPLLAGDLLFRLPLLLQPALQIFAN